MCLFIGIVETVALGPECVTGEYSYYCTNLWDWSVALLGGGSCFVIRHCRLTLIIRDEQLERNTRLASRHSGSSETLGSTNAVSAST